MVLETHTGLQKQLLKATMIYRKVTKSSYFDKCHAKTLFILSIILTQGIE